MLRARAIRTTEMNNQRSFNSISQLNRSQHRTTVPLVIFFMIIAGLMVFHVVSDPKDSSSSRHQRGMFDWLTKQTVRPLSIEELVQLDLDKQKIERQQKLIESGAGTTVPLSSSTTTQVTTETSTGHAKQKHVTVGADPLGGGDGVILSVQAKTTTTTVTKKDESTEVNLSHIPSPSSIAGNTASQNTVDHGRLHLYCNEQILPGVEGPTKFHGHEHFVLKDLIVTIRHGDRSGIHVMPGSVRVAHDSNFHSYHHDNPLIDPQALRYASKLGNLEIVKIPSKEKESQWVTSIKVCTQWKPLISFCLFSGRGYLECF